jgi:hypothetical protein
MVFPGTIEASDVRIMTRDAFELQVQLDVSPTNRTLAKDNTEEHANRVDRGNPPRFVGALNVRVIALPGAQISLFNSILQTKYNVLKL